MMRAGVSYVDWRAMTLWQQQDYMVRFYRDLQKFSQKAAKAKGISEFAGLLVSRLLGM